MEIRFLSIEANEILHDVLSMMGGIRAAVGLNWIGSRCVFAGA
jgi:hypothetical protein